MRHGRFSQYTSRDCMRGGASATARPQDLQAGNPREQRLGTAPITPALESTSGHWGGRWPLIRAFFFFFFLYLFFLLFCPGDGGLLQGLLGPLAIRLIEPADLVRAKAAAVNIDTAISRKRSVHLRSGINGLRPRKSWTRPCAHVVRCPPSTQAGSDIFSLNCCTAHLFRIKSLSLSPAGPASGGWPKADRPRCSLNAAPNRPAKQNRDFPATTA